MKKIIYAIHIIIGIILAILPLKTDCAAYNVFMPDGSYMPCHTLAKMLTVVGIIIIIFAIIALFVNSQLYNYLEAIILIVVSSFAILVLRGYINLASNSTITNHAHDMGMSMGGAVCEHCKHNLDNAQVIHDRFMFMYLIILIIAVVVGWLTLGYYFFRKKRYNEEKATDK